jgi:peptidoglycan/LPS O-acetylase OafA/YrhL
LLSFLRRSFPALSELQTGLIHIAIILPLAAVLFKYYERPITSWGKRRAAMMTVKATPVADTNVAEIESPFEIESGRHAGVAAL